MTNKSMADVISSRRKELGMTQKELADKLNITDKAVSKWERGIACPDTAAIPKLAQILGISLEELMDAEPAQNPGGEKAEQVLDVALKASDVKLAKLYAPPTETNFGGALLTGTRSACEAACTAFQEAIRLVAEQPIG